MLAPKSIKAISIKENSLLITKVIFVCYFWKITLSIKLKKFCLLPSSSSNFLSVGLENSFKFINSAIFHSFMSVEFSSLISLISFFTIFASVIKSCRFTGFYLCTILFYFHFFLFFLVFFFLSIIRNMVSIFFTFMTNGITNMSVSFLII